MYVLLKLKQCNANPGITANSKSQDIKILQAADRLSAFEDYTDSEKSKRN